MSGIDEDLVPLDHTTSCHVSIHLMSLHTCHSKRLRSFIVFRNVEFRGVAEVSIEA